MSATLGRRRLLAAGALGAALPGALRAQAESGAPTVEIVPAPTAVALLEEGYAPTPVWAYDGQVPGRPLRARIGDTLRVRLRNGLPAPTTIHWHGIRIDNAMDGVAGLTQPPVAPGGHFDYAFRLPDAGTYWYHPHYRSWEQQARGLYGALIVEEAKPPEVDDDLTLVFDDWRVTETGEIDEPSLGNLHDRAHAGRLGNVLTLNGQSYPELVVRAGSRVRMRLVNVATARVMSLRLSGHDATLVALDGQPVAPRVLAESRVTLAPAQRADIIVDMHAAPGSVHQWILRHRDSDVMAADMRYADEPAASAEAKGPVMALPPNALATPDLSNPLRAELRIEGGAMGGMRSAEFEGSELGVRELARRGMAWAMNGVVGRTDTPLFSARPGQTVEVILRNEGRWLHGMHFHGHHVQLLERNGRPVQYRDWRDTVLMGPNESVKVAFVADNPGKWMLHCHMLDHQAAGMATWFSVGHG